MKGKKWGGGARRRIDYLHDHGLLVGTTTSKSRITGTHDYFSSRDSTLLREKLNLPPYCFYCSFFFTLSATFYRKIGKTHCPKWKESTFGWRISGKRLCLLTNDSLKSSLLVAGDKKELICTWKSCVIRLYTNSFPKHQGTGTYSKLSG